jgi:hypothetical protein
MADKYLLVLTMVAASLLLIGGFVLAWHENDAEWVQRSGSAIVAVEALIVVLESRRRHRFERIPSPLKEGNPYIRIERAEPATLWAAILLAVIGELLHGFGDLAFEAVDRLW